MLWGYVTCWLRDRIQGESTCAQGAFRCGDLGSYHALKIYSTDFLVTKNDLLQRLMWDNLKVTSDTVKLLRW
jgi:hypothetical protein